MKPNKTLEQKLEEKRLKAKSEDLRRKKEEASKKMTEEVRGQVGPNTNMDETPVAMPSPLRPPPEPAKPFFCPPLPPPIEVPREYTKRASQTLPRVTLVTKPADDAAFNEIDKFLRSKHYTSATSSILRLGLLLALRLIETQPTLVEESWLLVLQSDGRRAKALPWCDYRTPPVT